MIRAVNITYGLEGGGGGNKKKNSWSTLKSKTKKTLGIGSPVFCIFFAHYTGLFKDMGKTEVRGKGGCDTWVITLQES